MKRKLCIVSVLILVCLMTSGFEKAQAEKPPLSAGRVTGEILAGGTAGFVCAMIGWVVGLYIGVEYFVPEGASDPWYPQAEKAMGVSAVIGSALGSSVGVYGVGNSGDETGSFLATLGGSMLGGLVAGGGGYLISHDRDSITWGVLGAPIGALIAFNLTRRFNSPPAPESQMSPAAPPIYFNLVRVRF